MRPMMILRALVVCIALFFQGAWAYQKYYVEDDCVLTTEFQKIEFRVPGTGQDSVGELRSNRYGTYSRAGRKCLIKLVPPEGYGIVLTILTLDFRNRTKCNDYIKVEESGEKLCSFEDLDQKSFYLDNDATIMYHTEEGGMGFNKGLKIVFTVSKMGSEIPNMNRELTGPLNSSLPTVPHEAEGIDPCPTDQFSCRNGRCVWGGVKCDGVDNCGDGSDEQGLESGCNVMTTLSLVSIVLGVASFSFIVVVMCLCCCKTPRNNIKPIRPYTPLVGYGTLPGDMIPTAPPQHYYFEKPPPYSFRAQPY